MGYLLRSSLFDFVTLLSLCDIGLIMRERERGYLEQWHDINPGIENVAVLIASSCKCGIITFARFDVIGARKIHN